MATMKKIILIATLLAFSAAAQAADPAAGREKAKVCAACHGEGGVGMSAMQDFPKLAGQYNDYIVRALKDYQSGARKNPVMADQAKNLKAADIADLAAWFSGGRALVGK
jgi:cytochrome c553